MNKYTKYLNLIGINTETLIKKIEKTMQAAERLCPEKIEEIYISDWSTEEGKREYENIYMFTSNYIIESSNFSTDTSINVEISTLKDRVKYLLIKYNDYFEKASEESRLSITFYTNGGAFEIKGAKENCDKLFEIYEKYIKANIAKIPIPE